MPEHYDADEDEEVEEGDAESLLDWADDLLDRLEVLRERAKERGYEDPDLVVAQAVRLSISDEISLVGQMLEAQADAHAEAAHALSAAAAGNPAPARPRQGPGARGPRPFSLTD